jgi:hypothetical protein
MVADHQSRGHQGGITEPARMTIARAAALLWLALVASPAFAGDPYPPQIAISFLAGNGVPYEFT